MTSFVSRLLGAAWVGLSVYAGKTGYEQTDSYLVGAVVGAVSLWLLMVAFTPIETAVARAAQRRLVGEGAFDIGKNLHVLALELVTVGMHEDALRILRRKLGPGAKPDEFVAWLGLDWMVTFELRERKLVSVTLWAETPEATTEHVAHLLSRLHVDRVEQDGVYTYVCVRGALITFDSDGTSTSVRIEQRRG